MHGSVRVGNVEVTIHEMMEEKDLLGNSVLCAAVSLSVWYLKLCHTEMKL